MGLFHKKEKKIELNKEAKIKFVIPQIEDEIGGLRRHKQSFESSVFASTLFGTGVKDEASYVDVAGHTDVVRAYDSFRVDSDKKLNDEEMIKRYGSRFPEFDKISNKTAEEVYGTKISINKKKVKKEEKVLETFSFIESAADLLPKNENVESKEEINEEKEEDAVGISFGDLDVKLDENEDDISSFKPTVSSIDLSMDDDLDSNESNLDDIKESSSVIVKREKVTKEPIFSERIFEQKKEEEPSISFKVEDAPKEEVQDIKPNINIIKEEVQNNPPSKEIPVIVNPYRDYKFPPIDIFKHSSDEEQETPSWVLEKKEVINQTLIDFDIAGEVTSFVKGPTFVRYEITLNAGVNVKKITQIEDTLLMNLEAKSIRIQAPIPGKKNVGIEVPNLKRDTVWFGDLITDSYLHDGKPLNLLLGKDIDGNIISTNVAKWPHGLVAGGTGSGKSVCINTMLVSLLLKNKPDDVKILIVDPKMVEFIAYNDLPHLITPVISDPEMASNALKWACDEMDRRYRDFVSKRVKDISGYNELAKKDISIQKMPYILIVIDELADLMQTCSQDVDDSIRRITAKARAAGIHLLLATQRPTTDVVSGTIKANVQARVAMRVSSQTDSMVILGETGAEALLGNGDMILKEADMPVRLQGSYIPEDEIYACTDFIRAQYPADYMFTHDDLKKQFSTEVLGVGVTSNQESPETLYEVARFFVESNSCSINSLQQQFSFGFNRAQKIVNALEQMGVVSKKNGTNKRDILVDIHQLNDIFERSDE